MTKPDRRQPVSAATLDLVASGRHHDPHSILGPHRNDGAVTIRTLRPLATSVTVETGSDVLELTHEQAGIWVGVIETDVVPDYRIRVTYGADTRLTDDPYRFLPTLGEIDLHLIAEGRHEQLWQVLGAHVVSYDTLAGPVSGTAFAVWAPNARAVRVVGDFNYWDGTSHPMRSLGSSGIWELFVPDVGDGACYKFTVLGPDDRWRTKADPMAQATEIPPATASRVFTSTYAWTDAEWLERRAASNPHTAAMATYEVHLGSWRPGLDYRALAHELTEYVVAQGFTHVELLPVAEHPFGGSWGYQITSYFAPTSRFGDPDGFRYLIDCLHRADIGVIVDWVPAHFPKDDFALARFDGTPLYEHSDPRRGEHPEWGTLIFDFGRREVRNFLVANAVYWCEEFHVDGLRVDAVASMLYLDYARAEGSWAPNIHGGRENLEAVGFLQEVNATLYRRVPGVVTIAEESTSWPGVTRPTNLGGLGFGLKWNMGWMHDTLDYVAHDPIHRQYHHKELTFALMYQWSEHFVLPLSHDEVVHGKRSLLRKMPGDAWRQFATLRAYLGYLYGHPGKKLLFMGGEFAQANEWSEAKGLDWWLLDYAEHRGVQSCVAQLNHVYQDTPALWARDHEPGGFEWIDANDAAANVFSWLRHDYHGNAVACITNFSAVPRSGYRLGLPNPGAWVEVLNTDAAEFGGSGTGNLGGVTATQVSWHSRPASAVLTLPPLGTVWLRGTTG